MNMPRTTWYKGTAELLSLKSMQENVAKRLSATPVTLSQGQGHWQWYKMEEVKGTYMHGKYKKKLEV